MGKIRCLVLDHDDTVVRSEETVNHPAFQQALNLLRPGKTITRQEFSQYCFSPGFFIMCRDLFGFTEEEHERQMDLWRDYVRTHVPPPYEGIKTILERFWAEGGIICVSSHSGVENISRDYQTHFGFLPHRIYGHELGDDKRKPSPFALEDIMAHYGLAPQELLMVDDMKAGFDMARSCGVPFACAGWSHHLPEIAAYMRQYSDIYFNSVQALYQYLFPCQES